MTNSNMAPGSEHDHRSGCDDEHEVDCPTCDGDGEIGGFECGSCDGTGEVPLSLFKALKSEEKEDNQANE